MIQRFLEVKLELATAEEGETQWQATVRCDSMPLSEHVLLDGGKSSAVSA